MNILTPFNQTKSQFRNIFSVPVCPYPFEIRSVSPSFNFQGIPIQHNFFPDFKIPPFFTFKWISREYLDQLNKCRRFYYAQSGRWISISTHSCNFIMEKTYRAFIQGFLNIFKSFQVVFTKRNTKLRNITLIFSFRFTAFICPPKMTATKRTFTIYKSRKPITKRFRWQFHNWNIVNNFLYVKQAVYDIVDI